MHSARPVFFSFLSNNEVHATVASSNCIQQGTPGTLSLTTLQCYRPSWFNMLHILLSVTSRAYLYLYYIYYIYVLNVDQNRRWHPTKVDASAAKCVLRAGLIAASRINWNGVLVRAVRSDSTDSSRCITNHANHNC